MIMFGNTEIVSRNTKAVFANKSSVFGIPPFVLAIKSSPVAVKRNFLRPDFKPARNPFLRFPYSKPAVGVVLVHCPSIIYERFSGEFGTDYA